MKVETLSEKYINEIGHAFGYYEYAQGEKGLVSAYSSKDAVVSYINGYVEMVLQAGMLYTTGPQQEAFIAYKRCDEKVGLKAGQKLIKGMFAESSFGEVVRMLSILGSGGSSSIEKKLKRKNKNTCLSDWYVCGKNIRDRAICGKHWSLRLQKATDWDFRSYWIPMQN